ncbi:MAG: hypothetical protein M1825_000744 [Sarcosagium campestre]|nr:MAG: hypothetical protein M1825_000744 [Sarcosagium campestre]
MAQSVLHSARASCGFCPFRRAQLLPRKCRTEFSSPIRAFHSSPRRQVLEPILSSTHTVIEAIHSGSGLPWVASLPLTALLIRVIIVTPFTYYSRRVGQRQLALQPLVLAWQQQIRRSVLIQSASLGPVECEKRVSKDLRAKTKELYKTWACRRWRNFLPIAQFPVFLIVIETLRGMSGIRQGLLGLVMNSLRSIFSQGPEAFFGKVLKLEAPLPVTQAVIPLEESLALEGALWFPDLLVADPQLILPFILSATVFSNIALANKKHGVQSRLQIWITRIMKASALAIGPLTLQLPSAMLVYWISSSLWALLHNVLLDRFLPLKPPIPPINPTVAHGTRQSVSPATQVPSTIVRP